MKNSKKLVDIYPKSMRGTIKLRNKVAIGTEKQKMHYLHGGLHKRRCSDWIILTDLMAFDEICKIIPYNSARLNGIERTRTRDTI